MFKRKQAFSAHNSSSKRFPSSEIEVFLGATGIFVFAMGIYQVRDFMAALLIFSVLFVTIGVVLLILLLLQELLRKGFTWMEATLTHIREPHIAPSTRALRGLRFRSHKWN